MVLGALGAILLENLLTGKGVKQAKTLDCVAKASNCMQANTPGQGVMKMGKGSFRAGQDV